MSWTVGCPYLFIYKGGTWSKFLINLLSRDSFKRGSQDKETNDLVIANLPELMELELIYHPDHFSTSHHAWYNINEILNLVCKQQSSTWIALSFVKATCVKTPNIVKWIRGQILSLLIVAKLIYEHLGKGSNEVSKFCLGYLHKSHYCTHVHVTVVVVYMNYGFK